MAAYPRFPRAALSRGIAGVRGRTLIVNLPGSTGGVRDGLRRARGARRARGGPGARRADGARIGGKTAYGATTATGLSAHATPNAQVSGPTPPLPTCPCPL